VISLFRETKIPTVDMKVQVYSKFSKNKIWKKMKSPSSMRNGRFDTPKYRGKVQKMGLLYIHPQRSPGLCNMQGPLNFYFFKVSKKFQKNRLRPVYTSGSPRPTSDCWSLAAAGHSCRVAGRLAVADWATIDQLAVTWSGATLVEERLRAPTAGC
jgi:hypothetical protein